MYPATSLRRAGVAPHMRGARRRTGQVLCAASLAAGLLSSPAVASAAAPSVAGDGTLRPDVTSCTVPVTTDTYDGFKVGVPAGWDLSTLDGEIGLSGNAGGTTGAVLYPALLTKGQTARSLFDALISYEQNVVRKAGGTFVYTQHAGAEPNATLAMKTDGVVEEGRASIMVLPLKTSVASKVGIFYAYWAPDAQYSAEAATLAAIPRCYTPVRATLFEVFHSAPYTFVMPPGWAITDSSTNYLQINGFNSQAGVDYELWGPFEQGVNATAPITSAQTALNYMLNLYKIEVTRVISSYVVPVTQTSAGNQAQEYEEFLGTLNGRPDHGIVYINADIDGGTAAGVIRLGLTSPSLWNSINGGVIEMMGSIQHNFTQDLEDIQAVNQQWQDFSGQVEDFDDVLNSQQLVEDPTTDNLYEAPYSSWDPSGPQGPGYYLPDGQELNPVSRS
jgi:hypothetical protein